MNNAVIIGAGPSGLAAGYCLASNNITPLVLEKDSQVGGMSKTIKYKNYRFDIGGHRFFTDLEEVGAFWNEILEDKLIKKTRLSRIYYKNKFFNYPLDPADTIKNVGVLNALKIAFSYLKSQCSRKKEIVTFEDYIIKHFGRKLFEIFFKTYTEKTWGMRCTEISCDWAQQRIRGLSAISAITTTIVPGQNNTIRTLVKEFYYPTLGPGMMYEKIAQNIDNMRGEIKTGIKIVKLLHNSKNILCAIGKDASGNYEEFDSDIFISSAPITEVVQMLSPAPPPDIIKASNELKYRNLLIVNLVCAEKDIFPDQWIYIHSPEVKLCRIQNYKNWSPYMIPLIDKTTLGLEYFCSEEDAIWNMQDKDLIALAQGELKRIGFKATAEDSFVYRVPKAYPVYTLGYHKPLNIIMDYLMQFDNLEIVGRSGRFRYDNMDGAIASGMSASKNIIERQKRKTQFLVV